MKQLKFTVTPEILRAALHISEEYELANIEIVPICNTRGEPFFNVTLRQNDGRPELTIQDVFVVTHYTPEQFVLEFKPRQDNVCD